MVSTANSAVLELAALASGTMPGLTSASGKLLAEAAAVCLDQHEHRSGVTLHLSGMRVHQYTLEWSPVDDQARRSHNDLQEATERGACGIAILIVRELTGMVVVERSRKGPGFDYWLGNGEDAELFQRTGRLEVSGILSGTQSQVRTRVKQKKEQVRPSDHLAPGYVAVIEFGTPLAWIEPT